MHKNRPKGLKYKITKPNKGWIKKGSVSWNTGKSWSKKIKEKISKNRKGKMLGNKICVGRKPWNKGIKISKDMIIAGYGNWKGGVTPVMLQVRHCFKYRQWRSDVFTRDNFTCQVCKLRGGYLEADHYPKMFSVIFSENKIKCLEEALICEELWNINNGRTLCLKCHNKTKKGGHKKYG